MNGLSDIGLIGLAVMDKNLPANLLQAQRDYFGVHTYERTGNSHVESFHTNWTGRGVKTSSSTYNV